MLRSKAQINLKDFIIQATKKSVCFFITVDVYCEHLLYDGDDVNSNNDNNDDGGNDDDNNDDDDDDV